MSRLTIALLGVALFSAPPLAAKKVEGPSGLELQQMQSHDFEAKMDVVYPSVISVLQDSGYRVQSADRASGLITATASTKSQTTYNVFHGLGKKKDTPVVSAFIEPRGARMTRVRLSFVMTETKARRYMAGQADEEPILDPAVYQKAFEQIEQAVFLRTSMDGPGEAETPKAAAPK